MNQLCIKEFKNIFFTFVVIILGSVNSNGDVFVYPKEDIVEKLPGQPEVGFKQLAGYIDVDEKAGRSFFYYFVEAENNATQLPLTLWLNGGPGCSSIGGGAFTELGPFFPSGDGRGLRRNEKSWNKVSNLLFVEAPAGVGFSYSNTSRDYTCGDDSTARDMVTFMLKWLEKFPTFKSRPLFLTGESYAGHYIPQLAIGLFNYNNNQSNNFKLNIKGIALGNPLLHLDKDVPAVYEFFWSHGMISDEVFDSITNECNFNDYDFSNSRNVTKSCLQSIDEANYIVSNYINVYDVILDVCYPSIVEQELRLRKLVIIFILSSYKNEFGSRCLHDGRDVCMTAERRFYLNLPEVQKALHANRTNLPYPWTPCTNMLDYSQEDADRNMLPLLVDIIKQGIPLWIFSGDQDSVVPLIGSRTLVRELAQELNLTITVPYGTWFHEGQVGGWQVEYGKKLTFATVRGASHMVPYAQPARALQLFDSFVNGRSLPNTTFPEIGGDPNQ